MTHDERRYRSEHRIIKTRRKKKISVHSSHRVKNCTSAEISHGSFVERRVWYYYAGPLGSHYLRIIDLGVVHSDNYDNWTASGIGPGPLFNSLLINISGCSVWRDGNSVVQDLLYVLTCTDQITLKQKELVTTRCSSSHKIWKLEFQGSIP